MLCKVEWLIFLALGDTGELGYDGPLYDGFLHMTDDMLGFSPMHIKYLSYVYDGFCILRTNFPGPIESVISKFTCTSFPILVRVKVLVVAETLCDPTEGKLTFVAGAVGTIRGSSLSV